MATFTILIHRRPALVTITDLRHQIDLAREIDSELQTKLRNISRARPIYERVEESIPIIEEALPEEKPLSSLINSLNIHASIAGVSISSLRISGKEETLVNGRSLFTNSLEQTHNRAENSVLKRDGTKQTAQNKKDQRVFSPALTHKRTLIRPKPYQGQLFRCF